ncbi:MAG: peptide-methionine (R)-S-oxide reductase MsrB [Rubellimicrobium sp.]|nr:peptide-methionine (R)-S-oxide reductase MsrB [Rubellimicrobium sp.]
MPRLVKTEAEWRAALSPLAYRVTREHGTERPFSHDDPAPGPGRYLCIGCGTALFATGDRFEAGCGWPSFTRPIDGETTGAGIVGQSADDRFGMSRTEVHCTGCGAHLGHVFTDGPPPSRLRYCINGVALAFEGRD